MLGVSVLATAALGLGSVSLWYTAQKLGDVEQVDVAGALTAVTAVDEQPVTADQLEIITPEVMAENATSTTVRTEPPRPAENYLIVGSDNAEEIDPDDPIISGREDQLDNNLADTIMVLRLEPATGAAYLLSVPRDLEVTVAGSGAVQKVNAAFNYEEPYPDRVTRLIDTVEENLDIGLQHYIEVDLAAFQRLVDSVGGVEVCFAGPSQDPATGLYIPSGGWHTLNGSSALAFVRSRKMETMDVEGVWRNVSGRADLDRIERQQDFVSEAVDQAAGGIFSSPSLLLDVLDIAADELVVSNSFSVVSDGRSLAGWFRGIEDDDLVTMSLEVADLPVTAERNNEYRLEMTSAAEGQLDIFRGIGPLDVVPKRVDVEVIGSPDVVEGLAELGFVANAANGDPGDVVRIRYGLGGHDAANLVAAFLDSSVEFVVDEDLFGLAVVVETGADAPAVLAEPRALTEAAIELVIPTTTTEAPAVTTTTPPVASPWPFDCSAPRDDG